ncbi:MAG: response regulator [Polyangiales bacterium]
MVDDEEGILRTFRRILEPPYDVTTASSAADAIAAMDAYPTFDAIVCDVRMPSMTGPMLHAAILERHPPLATRFVFVTATPPDGELICGARVLAKPVSRRDLLDAVEGIVQATASH